MTQSVIRRHLARYIQNQTAQRIPLIGIGLNTPVRTIDIFLDGRSDIDQRSSILPQAVTLVTIRGIGTECPRVIGIDQHLFDDILNLLDRRRGTGKTVSQHFQRPLRQKLRFILAEITGRTTSLGKRNRNPFGIERHFGTVALDDTLG